MKRIIACISLVLVTFSAVFFFGACSVKTKSSDRYYDSVVAYVGDEVLTREEFLTVFNNYAQYYLNYGYTYDDLYEMVFDMLINQKVLLNEARADITLTSSEKNEIWDSVRSSINSTLDSYEDQARKLLDTDERDSDSSTAEEAKVFEKYVRSLPAEERASETNETINAGFTAPKREDNFYRYLAYNRYLNDLQKNAEIKGKKLTKEQAFDEEINRLYKKYEDSKLVSLYQSKIKSEIVISDEEIVERYTTLLNTQIQSYAVSGTYNKLVRSTSPSEFIYYYDDNADTYFYTQQILLKFSSEQSESISEYKVTHSDYEEYLWSLVPDIEISYTDADGEKQKKTDDEVMDEIDAMIAKYNDATNEETYRNQKLLAESFYELKFYYSGDSNVQDLTSLTNIYGYSFPTDRSKLTSEYDTYSFYKSYTDKAYELRASFLTNDTYDIGYCVSDYGLHIIMYTGSNPGGKVAEENYASLNTTYMSLVTDETIADYVYEIILKEKQDSVVNSKVSYLASEYNKNNKIKKVVNNYQELTK